MTDQSPVEPTPSESNDVADKSKAAGIADEGAAYTNAIDKEEAGEAEAHPS